jgi:hypothetical protein
MYSLHLGQNNLRYNKVAVLLYYVNAEEIKCMFMPHYQNIEQNHNIKAVNKCFKNVAEFKFLGVTVTYHN